MGFAEFMFGPAGRSPGRFAQLLRMRGQVFTPVAELKADILPSDEPIPFEEIDPAAFHPIKPGTRWGKKMDCAWLHIHGHGPHQEEGDDLAVLLGIRGEALVYSPDGTVLDSVSTVWVQGEHPHPLGKFREVRGVTPTGHIDFYADAAYNGFLLYDYGDATYYGACVARINREAYDLYFDYLVLAVLEDATDDSMLAAEIGEALDSVDDLLEGAAFQEARARLAPLLQRPSTSDFVYRAIGHGHLDMAWLWPLRETQRKAARTYARALNTIERNPGFIYGTSQPQQLDWIRQQKPRLFSRIQQAVADGRIELQGAFWVEPDTNLPSGESLVRQALTGRQFLKEHFGIDQMQLCWLPDTFGYNGNLPQILKKSGMDWFQTIKLSWNKTNVFPHRTFHWSGIDGSTVLVHMPPEGDYNSRADALSLLKGLEQYPERDTGTALLAYGSGDGGGGPSDVHLEILKRERDLHGLPRVEFGAAADLFRELEQQPGLPRHQGELYLETHQGTYTTQAAMKKGNRLAERLLHNAEALAVAVGAAGVNSREDLADAWRTVLLHQFHDILPGSSIERVHREARQVYRDLEKRLTSHICDLVDAVRDEGAEPTAINLTSFPRHEHMKLGDRWFAADVAPYAASALVPIDDGEQDWGGSLSFDDNSMSNGELTLTFAPDGHIASCLDSSGAEHAGGGLNRLVLHRDHYQFPFDAWDIDRGYLRRKPRLLKLLRAETFRDGPTVVRRQLLQGSSIPGKPGVIVEQRVVLEEGSPVVRFDTRINWTARHHMLRADFWPSHYGETAASEIQFGHIHRPTTENDSVEEAQFETCAHKWIATEDEGGGFALLNDSKYGHRAKNGLISLNLLRSPTFPDKKADRGFHRFSYAFMPFGRGRLEDVIREGYRLNNPLLPGDGAKFGSLVGSSNPAVIVETVKPAEDGNGVVLRLYESLGKPATTALNTSLAHAGARFTDLLENDLGPADLQNLEFGPFEIVTIRLPQPAVIDSVSGGAQ